MFGNDRMLSGCVVLRSKHKTLALVCSLAERVHGMHGPRMPRSEELTDVTTQRTLCLGHVHEMYVSGTRAPSAKHGEHQSYTEVPRHLRRVPSPGRYVQHHATPHIVLTMCAFRKVKVTHDVGYGFRSRSSHAQS